MPTANKSPDTWQEFLTPFNSFSPPTPAHPKTQQLKALFRKGSSNHCLLKTELCSEHLTVSSVHQIWYNQNSRFCKPENMIYISLSCCPTLTFLNRSPPSLSDILLKQVQVPITSYKDAANHRADRSEIIQSQENHLLISSSDFLNSA